MDGTHPETQNCSLCGHSVPIAGKQEGSKLACPACGVVLEVSRAGQGKVFGDIASGDTIGGPMAGGGKAGSGPTVAIGPESEGTGSSPIPGYVVLEELGRGGMAVVFKAKQTSLDRIVALKIMAKRLAADEDFVRRFEREAKALAALNHPNITSVFDRGQAGDKIYFVMEFVEGLALRDVLKQAGGRLPQERALPILIQTAEALAYVHARGTIHRDIKPENVLLAAGDKVKVTDFGLAAMADRTGDMNLTGAGMMMGTLNYMPPEQRSDAKSVDHRADIYSFGVLLYECLTGHIPIGKWDPASSVVPTLDPRFDEIISLCLKSNRDERYQSVDQVVTALTEVRDGPAPSSELNIPLMGASEPSSPPPPGPGFTASPPSGVGPSAAMKSSPLPDESAGYRPASSSSGASNDRDLERLVAAARKDMLTQRTRGLPTRITQAPGLDPPKRRLRTFLLAMVVLLVAASGAYLVYEPILLAGFLVHYPRSKIEALPPGTQHDLLMQAYVAAVKRVTKITRGNPGALEPVLSLEDPRYVVVGLRGLRLGEDALAVALAGRFLHDKREPVFLAAANTLLSLARKGFEDARRQLKKAHGDYNLSNDSARARALAARLSKVTPPDAPTPEGGPEAAPDEGEAGGDDDDL